MNSFLVAGCNNSQNQSTTNANFSVMSCNLKLDKPDGGKNAWENRLIYNMNSESFAEFRNRKPGFVFQFHHLLPEFTAFENITTPALIQGEFSLKLKTEST